MLAVMWRRRCHQYASGTTRHRDTCTTVGVDGGRMRNEIDWRHPPREIRSTMPPFQWFDFVRVDNTRHTRRASSSSPSGDNRDRLSIVRGETVTLLDVA